MKRVPPPVHNALQAYLRSVLGRDSVRLVQQPTKCLSCTQVVRNSPRPRSITTTAAAISSTWQACTRHQRRARMTQKPVREMAMVHDVPDRNSYGPLKEYEDRIYSRRLREDDHQRTIIEHLQDLYETLSQYNPPPVKFPSIRSLEPPKKSFLTSVFGGSKSGPAIASLPEDLPKGLYMYGDVGSGKTMMMDLFFETAPPNIPPEKRTRIHFHNFMQDVHKRLHKTRMRYGNDFDAVPLVAAEIAQNATLLCFDEFQCTDVADAMILRRLIEALMSHGVVIVTTSNRHPDDLYKNGIQRESFLPCINLLKRQMRVINLDSSTDYRKLPRPPSGVYHHPLDRAAQTHADKWFAFLGDPKNDPPHPGSITVWGREVQIPQVSGRAARFTFHELIGRATGAADYIEMMRYFDAFIITDIPGMTHRQRDWARRFITFIDAIYESRAKLVLTTAVPLSQLFMSRAEIDESLQAVAAKTQNQPNSTTQAEKTVAARTQTQKEDGHDVDDVMRMMMDDLGMSMGVLKQSNFFSGDEERFAFARALSRLSEMGGVEWVERGLGLEKRGGLAEKSSWGRVRSKQVEDFM